MNPKFKMPDHKPDPDLWNRIEAEMDYLELVETTNMNVKEVPVHSPAERVWQAIESRLPFIPYYRRAYFRVGMVMLAIVLVSFLGWLISQLIIDITPETIIPAENTTIQQSTEAEETATIHSYDGANAPLVDQDSKDNFIVVEDAASENTVVDDFGPIAETEPPIFINEENTLDEEQPTFVIEEENTDSQELLTLARDKPPDKTGRQEDALEMASYRFDKTTSSSLMADEDDYYVPKRKRGHITLGAYTMPEYMQFSGDSPDNSALSSNYGASFKYNWSTYFIETGLGYRQFTANSLYGINFSDLNLLGSVMLMEFQILQYYNDEGELVIEKIYKPTFVEVYDTASVIVEEETEQRYSFIDIPLYFGKVLWSINRYAIAVKGGTRINIPVKVDENVPTPPPHDADLVTVEPMAVLSSKFFIQFNLAIENRIHFSDRGYFSLDPMLGYHQQSIEYYNEVKKQSSWSAGLRVGIHYQLK